MDKPRLVYLPREDATPEGELCALAEVYRFVLGCHEQKEEVAEVCEDGDGTEDGQEGGSSESPVTRLAALDSYPAEEEQTVDDYCADDEPVRIELYLDYCDGADEYPVIALCDECAEDARGNVGELTRLTAGEAAECEGCVRMNAAAVRARMT